MLHSYTYLFLSSGTCLDISISPQAATAAAIESSNAGSLGCLKSTGIIPLSGILAIK